MLWLFAIALQNLLNHFCLLSANADGHTEIAAPVQTLTFHHCLIVVAGCMLAAGTTIVFPRTLELFDNPRGTTRGTTRLNHCFDTFWWASSKAMQSYAKSSWKRHFWQRSLDDAGVSKLDAYYFLIDWIHFDRDLVGDRGDRGETRVLVGTTPDQLAKEGVWCLHLYREIEGAPISCCDGDNMGQLWLLGNILKFWGKPSRETCPMYLDVQFDHLVILVVRQ